MQFPLPLEQFAEAIPVAKLTFRLADPKSMSRTGGGDVIQHRRGARLWGGELQIDLDDHDAHAQTEALLARLEEPDASLLIYDLRKPYPASDPTGSVASSAVKIASLGADGWSLALTGLPAGYTLTRGDLLAFQYGANPIRYAYHRLVTGAVASGTGVTPSFEVVPAIRPGAAIDAAVSLVKPPLKARLIEADYGEGQAFISPGGKARWVQSLR